MHENMENGRVVKILIHLHILPIYVHLATYMELVTMDVRKFLLIGGNRMAISYESSMCAIMQVRPPKEEN